MSNGREIKYQIPDNFYHELVVRENALVILNDTAADVNVETSNFFARLGEKPDQAVTTRCESVRTWTISGKHSTGSNGTARIFLNKFLECIPGKIDGTHYSNYIGSRPNFSASPETEDPAFLTFTIDAQPTPPPPQGQIFLPTAYDIEITVRSWKHDGNAAPNIPFSWIAIAQTATAISLAS
ncbi:MAG: hypothetical protein PVJ37_16720 [Desulfobacterales bacterium]|jgi:hypothetical protein